MLFVWSTYDTDGGFNDYMTSMDCLTEIIERGFVHVGEFGHDKQFHVVDLTTMEVVFEAYSGEREAKQGTY